MVYGRLVFKPRPSAGWAWLIVLALAGLAALAATLLAASSRRALEIRKVVRVARPKPRIYYPSQERPPSLVRELAAVLPCFTGSTRDCSGRFSISILAYGNLHRTSAVINLRTLSLQPRLKHRALGAPVVPNAPVSL